jgi:hypothetical protein
MGKPGHVVRLCAPLSAEQRTHVRWTVKLGVGERIALRFPELLVGRKEEETSPHTRQKANLT